VTPRWWWRRLWRDSRVDLLCPLSIEDAAARLDEGRFRRWTQVRGLDEELPAVMGRIRGGRVRLTAVVHPPRNSWRPALHGRLVPDDRGSRLVGGIGCGVLVRAFSAVWLAIDLTFVVVLLTRLVTAVLALAPLAMGAGFVVLTGIALRAGEKEESFLRAWITQRLEAA
jgi:hypothetical protein